MDIDIKKELENLIEERDKRIKIINQLQTEAIALNGVINYLQGKEKQEVNKEELKEKVEEIKHKMESQQDGVGTGVR